jgi:ribulose bisphosphate carboxylase small subunit
MHLKKSTRSAHNTCAFKNRLHALRSKEKAQTCRKHHAKKKYVRLFSSDNATKTGGHHKVYIVIAIGISL